MSETKTITKDEFVVKAITVLPRKKKNSEELEEGIHVVFSQFNKLYQKCFECDLEQTKADLEDMEKRGLIQIRPVRKGVKLYLGDAEVPVDSMEKAMEKMGLTL